MGKLSDAFMTARYPLGPGHRGVDTSVAAAEQIRPHVGMQHEKILGFLRARGRNGATYSEIVDGTRMMTPSVCARLVELVNMKLVEVSDRKRKTASGRAARVYIVPAGK